MNRTVSHKKINTYYQSSQWMYRLFCYTPMTLGMHFGFWEKGTKNRQEAILNQNREIIRVGRVRRGMRVLDAGCGIGGSVIYIAQTTGASVWGISLDPKAITIAKRYSGERGLASCTHFSVQNYTQTNFPDNFFDVVYGIESICYASPKIAFLKEAYRVLKPGGTLVIQDGYVSRQPKTPQERRILSDFTWAWALPSMITNTAMCREMSRAGFLGTAGRDFTKEVVPSVKYFRLWGMTTGLICSLTKYIPIESIHSIYRNYLAIKVIEEGYHIGLSAYWEQYATKPLRKTNRNTPN
jgi:tocopherol O-methyltransferase